MSTTSLPPAARFVASHESELEKLPGKLHYWYCKPGMVKDTNLLFIRVQLPPGQCHSFHYHPHMEEILYILSGTAEQWCEREKRLLKAGDSLYVPAGMVHATFNATQENLEFLAILAPAKNPGPAAVEIGDQEPWKSLRH
jgi:quercetin dioxygenase-like cupin family protein